MFWFHRREEEKILGKVRSHQLRRNRTPAPYVKSLLSHWALKTANSLPLTPINLIGLGVAKASTFGSYLLLSNYICTSITLLCV